MTNMTPSVRRTLLMWWTRKSPNGQKYFLSFIFKWLPHSW